MKLREGNGSVVEDEARREAKNRQTVLGLKGLAENLKVYSEE